MNTTQDNDIRNLFDQSPNTNTNFYLVRTNPSLHGLHSGYKIPSLQNILAPLFIWEKIVFFSSWKENKNSFFFFFKPISLGGKEEERSYWTDCDVHMFGGAPAQWAADLWPRRQHPKKFWEPLVWSLQKSFRRKEFVSKVLRLLQISQTNYVSLVFALTKFSINCGRLILICLTVW